ncbi:hypothetical protein KFL_005010010 [Klebsormidium nitens]|uniref:Uncharacterized protein n=1 Tax=Klebsormidium nitens TaxID=105231 RepID=A0A1Y1IGP8_KLENI|nr:hypothetical protein KFL_005010010 [Klebsormidium nitens]|eukprot:GAQ89232.1 hypothetical protein KFL_005010010 [Klebsormidium nitens]
MAQAESGAMRAKGSANEPGLPFKEQTLKVAYTALGTAGMLMAAAKIAFPAQVLALDFPGTAITAELCRAQRVLGGALLPGVAAAFVLRDAAERKELDTGDALRLNIGLVAFGVGVANSLTRIPVGVILDSKANALGLVSSAASIIVGCIGASAAFTSKHRSTNKGVADGKAALLSFIKPKNASSLLYGVFSIIFGYAALSTFRQPSAPPNLSIPFVYTGVGASVLLELLMASGTLVAPLAALTLKAASDKGQLSSRRAKLLNGGILGVAAGFGVTMVEGMVTLGAFPTPILVRVGIWAVVGVTSGLNLFKGKKRD